MGGGHDEHVALPFERQHPVAEGHVSREDVEGSGIDAEGGQIDMLEADGDRPGLHRLAVGGEPQQRLVLGDEPQVQKNLQQAGLAGLLPRGASLLELLPRDQPSLDQELSEVPLHRWLLLRVRLAFAVSGDDLPPPVGPLLAG
jgi:hypothetical protein